MTQYKTDSDGQIVIGWYLHDIVKACASLRGPMKDKGMSHKLDVIEKMVADITLRIS